MRSFILPLILALLSPACAHAQPEPFDGQALDARPSRLDEPLLRVCLADADKEDRDCVGTVVARCREQMGDGADTTGGAVMCADRERAAWSGVMQGAIAQLRARETPTQVAALDAALAEGERWAAARCAYAASIFEGGSLARQIHAMCARETMAERTLDLLQRLSDYEEF